MVNCAAWTGSTPPRTTRQALAINGHGAGNLAAACATSGALLVHPSTDYVFDGNAAAPYAEDAPTAPVGAYGRTKLAGEQAVRAALPDASYIVRTAWLYGAHGKNFVKTMLRLARNGTAPGVVADQHGQPTWTADVAAQIYALITKSAPPGTYHATSSGQTTWFAFAAEIFTLYQGQDRDQGHIEDSERVRLTPRPITTTDYPTPARRPAYSVLGHDAWRAAGIPRSATGKPPSTAPSPQSSPTRTRNRDGPPAGYTDPAARIRAVHGTLSHPNSAYFRQIRAVARHLPQLSAQVARYTNKLSDIAS